MLKLIKTVDAVGHVLCHDITQIIPGVTKDALFRKGHIVTPDDIPLLLSVGKDNLYVWERHEGMLHENEAAERLCNVCINEHMHKSDVKEGKIELVSDTDGLLKVDENRLYEINSIDEIMIATRHSNTKVQKGDKLAGMRVIPLVIDEKKLDEVDKIFDGEPIIKVVPWKLKTAGIVTTGNEVYYNRITDKFTPVIKEKLSHYGIDVCQHVLSDDNIEHIKDAIKQIKDKGVDMILCTGGMSVDPDDCTPGAIKATGANIVTYGAPVLPGAMFLLGYFDDGTPIMGLPGCAMYAKATILDLVLPRIVVGEKLTKKDFAKMGNGGLCLGCSKCHYPNCSFGKGI